jgi:hypothetical protein
MVRRITLPLLLLLPLQAWAQSTVTKAQLRSQDQRTTERQLKDQLWGIFKPVDERRRDGRPAPRRPLDDSWLTSRSYATQVPGLCRIDSVTLHFAPVGDGVRTARTPVRAYGLDAAPFYHFRKSPKGWHDDIVDHERSPLDQECEGLDLYKQDFFSAPDDWIATDGYHAMLLATRASAGGKVQPKCEAGAFLQRSCEAFVADFTTGAISNIERCEPIPSRSCYEITDERNTKLRVAFDARNEVQSVDLEQMIMVADERID